MAKINNETIISTKVTPPSPRARLRSARNNRRFRLNPEFFSSISRPAPSGPDHIQQFIGGIHGRFVCANIIRPGDAYHHAYHRHIRFRHKGESLSRNVVLTQDAGSQRGVRSTVKTANGRMPVNTQFRSGSTIHGAAFPIALLNHGVHRICSMFGVFAHGSAHRLNVLARISIRSGRSLQIRELRGDGPPLP